MITPVLDVRELAVEFASGEGPVGVVEDVSLSLQAGETLGMVGESGCGKSVTALAIMGLLPAASARVRAGSIRFDGVDIHHSTEARLRSLRGNGMAMIFQDPTTALNPVRSVGRQIGDVLARRTGVHRPSRRRRAIELLERVGIGSPSRRVDAYPHQLSGGMRQRVMIAMALACRPKLLIADEPTTALDVTTQAQVLEQIRELQHEIGTAVLLVTHDLGVVAESCQRAAVMYCGRIVETAPVAGLFSTPHHRYTEGLLAAAPRVRAQPPERLPVIPGTVPSPRDRRPGCRFAPRCAHASERCRQYTPQLTPMDAARVACFHPANSSEQ
jgi:oligopeptide/dipeptide ABC transporter ATP-binding protein